MELDYIEQHFFKVIFLVIFLKIGWMNLHLNFDFKKTVKLKYIL